jgi:hypothetical protein
MKWKKIDTLARLVDLPTPLTPTKVIEYGLLFFLASIASLNISMCRRGVNIRTNADCIAGLIIFYFISILYSNIFIVQKHDK